MYRGKDVTDSIAPGSGVVYERFVCLRTMTMRCPCRVCKNQNLGTLRWVSMAKRNGRLRAEATLAEEYTMIGERGAGMVHSVLGERATRMGLLTIGAGPSTKKLHTMICYDPWL